MKPRSRVIVRKSTYEYGTVRKAFFEIMDAIGGRAIKQSDRVLIKPNLLAPANPAEAVLTHPTIVRAAAEYCLERGASPQVSDSPAMGSFEKVMKASGIGPALEGLNCVCRPFQGALKVHVGEPFHQIEIAEDAIRADVIINLPKLKSHGQMLLTLGVKNMFGCIIGYRKAEWHMKAGIDRAVFAKLLVQIYQRLKPSFTVLDGILALEGEGPGKSGVPRRIGILMGGNDALAVDHTVCRMLGLPHDRLPTLRLAKEMGVMDTDIEIEGDMPAITDFKLPVMSPLVFGPRIFHGYMRKRLLAKPVADRATCILCAECEKICPAKVISIREKILDFDYDRCIRCFCCIEVCPQGSLHARETLAGRIIRKMTAGHL